jgi:MFS family permease
VAAFALRVSPPQRRFTRSFAALAAAVPVFRPGTTSPGGSAPFASAPLTHGRSRRAPASKIRSSLRICTSEGLVAETVTACAGGAVLTGWAMYLGASPLLIGLVAALPQLAQLVQLPAAVTTHLLGHRRACLWMVGLSRQALLPMVVLPFLPLPDPTRQGVLLAVAALSAVLGVLGNNAWVAWMGELVPRPLRGRYFGRRTALCTLGGALASAGAGALLDALRARGDAGMALAGLAVLACLAGAVTVLLLARQHDPSPEHGRAALPTLAQALRPFRDPEARGFLVYQLAWNGAVGLAASYFALHMLRNLGMGFTLMAVHGAAVAGMRMVAAPLWGRAIDRVGARPVLLFCSFGVSVIPLLWLFPTKDMLLLPLAVDVVLSGILWGGHGVAAFALPLSVAPRSGRPFYLAAFAMTGGVAFTLATVAGGLLVQALPDRFVLFDRPLHDLHVLFLLTSVCRVGAATWGLRIVEPGARRVPELVRQLPRLVRPARAAPPRALALDKPRSRG